jgi:phytoene desaturase
VAIIGAGMGGLAAAIRLRLMGFEVEVFEKNEQPGGRVGRLREDGFTFDTGPTLLLMTDVYRDLFAAAGRNLDNEIALVNLDPNYRVHFGDGDSIKVSSSLPALIPELERIEPGVTPRFYRFMQDACLKYRLGRSEFVERDFEKAGAFFGPRNLKLLLKTKAVNNYYRSVSKFFKTEKLRQTFSFQTMYLGLSPFEAPAVYALLPYTELAEDGLWFPRGGMYELVEAMVRLAHDLGVGHQSKQSCGRDSGRGWQGARCARERRGGRDRRRARERRPSVRLSEAPAPLGGRGRLQVEAAQAGEAPVHCLLAHALPGPRQEAGSHVAPQRLPLGALQGELRADLLRAQAPRRPVVLHQRPLAHG